MGHTTLKRVSNGRRACKVLKSTFNFYEKILSRLSDPKALRKETNYHFVKPSLGGQIAGAFVADILYHVIYIKILKKSSDSANIQRNSAEIGRRIGRGGCDGLN